MNKGVNYSMFYDILLNLREDFHSYGRIDDSQATRWHCLACSST